MSFWFKRSQEKYKEVAKQYEGNPEKQLLMLEDQRLDDSAFYEFMEMGVDASIGFGGLLYLINSASAGQLDHVTAHLWSGYVGGKIGKRVYNALVGKHPILDRIRGSISLREEDEVIQTSGSYKAQAIAAIAAGAAIEIAQGTGIIPGTAHFENGALTASGVTGGIITSIDGIDDVDYLAYGEAVRKVKEGTA